ncbi:MAG: sulfatase-like hydrolase/transferase, partial [Nanoarchaeota archaeon]|nr:sulfatase-like hydrolase/transferase [Nanoarchaeota archaeon]
RLSLFFIKSKVMKGFVALVFLVIFVILVKYYFFDNSISDRIEDYNIIMISLDTTRADHLPCYGYEIDTAPNLCRFAEDSVLFENFIVHSYLTPISQMSIFTSQLPSNNGVISFFSKLNNSVQTLPEILKYQGYRTLSIGSSPEFASYFDLGENRTIVHSNFERGFDSHEYVGSRDIPWKAIDILGDIKDDKFFLWVPIGTVHFPYSLYVPDEISMKFSSSYDGLLKSKLFFDYETLSYVYDGFFYNSKDSYGSPVPLTVKDEDYIISKYDAGIYYVDTFIGELLDQLQSLGLDDNTIVIIHGVHGEDLGEHGYFSHYDIYDTEVHSPLIIKFPRRPAAKKVKNQVRGIDVLPTLIDFLGFKISDSFEGISLLPLIDGVDIDPLDCYIERIPLWEEGILRFDQAFDSLPQEYHSFLKDFFKEYPENMPSSSDVAVRVDDWKMIHRRSRYIEKEVSWWGFLKNESMERDEFELYNLKVDPYELNNVIHENFEITSALKKKLISFEESAY